MPLIPGTLVTLALNDGYGTRNVWSRPSHHNQTSDEPRRTFGLVHHGDVVLLLEIDDEGDPPWVWLRVATEHAVGWIVVNRGEVRR